MGKEATAGNPPATVPPLLTPRAAPVRRPAGRMLIFGALCFGLLLGAVLAIGFARAAAAARQSFWSSLYGQLLGRSTTVDVSSPAVVDKIRKLSRLETVIYSIDKIVYGEHQNPVLPSFLTGDKLLLVAHGEVIAGVDLSQLQDGDVTVHGDSVRIHLPAAQVLTTRIDNSRSRVYSRSTGLLVVPDPDLETTVRRAAEDQITQAAIADGILDRAHLNAQAAVSALLYGLGFRNVEVA